MCLDRAQGLNNALADAALFVDGIKQMIESPQSAKKSLKDVVDRYDQEVLARGKQEIAISLEQGYGVMHWEKVSESPSMKHGNKNLYRPEGD